MEKDRRKGEKKIQEKKRWIFKERNNRASERGRSHNEYVVTLVLSTVTCFPVLWGTFLISHCLNRYTSISCILGRDYLSEKKDFSLDALTIAFYDLSIMKSCIIGNDCQIALDGLVSLG